MAQKGMVMAERQTEEVRRDFTEPEIARMHEQLVVAVGTVRSLREQKVQATGLINQQIKASELEVWGLQSKLETGYEMIEVETFDLMDVPKAGWKTIVRADTNEHLREIPMSPRERQQQLFTDLPDTGTPGD